ncbi:MAG: G/U mismatch-specific DNA glycosylase [Chloroflexi bacterium]|nr:MAG: G/U mismatch-specific DNA glycosylase [Chloroflexota bacterium]
MNRKPTKQEIQAAAGKTVRDVIAPNLKVLFVGINPGLYTAAIGHHFGRPGNRFWPAIYKAGFTPRLLSPYEETELLEFGYGITNIVARATTGANELSKKELIEGGRLLEEKVHTYRPRLLAVLGVSAYRHAFNHPDAVVGKQTEMIANTPVWVLPNPSGLNAHYNLDNLADVYREVRIAGDG